MLQAETFATLDAAFADINSPQQAFAVTCKLANQLGFEHVIHAPVMNHPDTTKNWAATTYPSSWQEIYQAKGYLSRNPVRQRTKISSVPFLLSSLEKELPKRDRELFVDCRACGMRDGYVVPVHGAWGQAVAIGFACQSLDAIANPGRTALQLLAYKLHHLFDQMHPQAEVRITRRERQVLQLLAQGRQNPEIADKLNVSDHSVEWHLRNIYRKLSVNNRTAAVVKAIQSSLLEL
jgi:DNA-binding CsgD family transcriptional regulator